MWGEKTEIVVGDSRTHSLVDNEAEVRLKNLERYAANGLKLTESLNQIEKILTDNAKEGATLIDVLIILGLHGDLTKLTEWKSTGCQIMISNN